MSSINLFYIILFLTVLNSYSEATKVITSVGLITGYLKTSYEGKRYSAFEGIPYAKPPVGNLRFEEPQPAEPWVGTWNATTLHECIQSTLFNVISGEEDCLYMNIYVPREQPLKLEELPVIVHIHGGGFKEGSPHSYTAPDYLMDKNVIFVSFNYRLGAFGFLTTGDEVVPGNLGLKDQLLALKWIKENINYFGGNPNSVTLTGFSAGAACSHLHYLSPKSKGLFHRGVSHSGNALGAWTTKPIEQAKEMSKPLAKVLGCPADTSREMIDCMKTRPAMDIIKKLIGLTDNFYMMNFVPVVDGDFLTKMPIDLLTEKNVPDIPWIFSATSQDGLMPVAIFSKELEQFNAGWTQMAPQALFFSKTQPKSDWEKISKTIKDFYIGENTDITPSTYQQLVKLFTDRYFLSDSERSAKLQSKAGKSSVYYYYFNYRGTNTFTDLFVPDMEPEFEGIGHGDDIIHLYGDIFQNRKLSESDVKIKETLLDLLVSFARTGKPTIEGVDWKPTKHDELTYLNITSPYDINVLTQKTISNIHFWNKLNLENLKQNQKDEL